MKKLIVNVVAGAVLFAGSMAGMLAATGRLNHEGTQSIPLLGALFPAPEKPAEGKDAAKDEGKDAAKDADKDGAKTHEPAKAAPVAQGPETPTLKRGRSLFDKEEKPEDGQGGGAAKEGHGDQKPDDHAKADTHAEQPKAPEPRPEPTVANLQGQTSHRREVSYTPGSYFKFDGMPAGVTPEQLNEAWQRVQQQIAELDKRKSALDQREQQMQTLEQDVARRQTDLGSERTKLQNLQQAIEARIEQFHQQVKMVRLDEVAGLKRNAATLAALEVSKAAELVKEQWRTEAGQDLILKTLEVMDKDAANTILGALSDNVLLREILDRRLRLVREAAAGPGK